MALFIESVAEGDVDGSEAAVLVKIVVFFSDTINVITFTLCVLGTGGFLYFRGLFFVFGYGFRAGIDETGDVLALVYREKHRRNGFLPSIKFINQSLFNWER